MTNYIASQMIHQMNLHLFTSKFMEVRFAGKTSGANTITSKLILKLCQFAKFIKFTCQHTRGSSSNYSCWYDSCC